MGLSTVDSPRGIDSIGRHDAIRWDAQIGRRPAHRLPLLHPVHDGASNPIHASEQRGSPLHLPCLNKLANLA